MFDHNRKIPNNVWNIRNSRFMYLFGIYVTFDTRRVSIMVEVISSIEGNAKITILTNKWTYHKNFHLNSDEDISMFLKRIKEWYQETIKTIG